MSRQWKIFGFCAVVTLLMVVPALSADQEPKTAKKPAVAKVGLPLPDFSLVDRDGRVWKLSEHKDAKVLLVTIGRTSCLCGAEALVDLQKVLDKYKTRGLQVVHVNTEPERLTIEPGYLTKFARLSKVSYPLLIDKDMSVSAKFPSPYIPALFLADKEGIVRFTLFGHPQTYLTQVSAEVEKYLPSQRSDVSGDQKLSDQPVTEKAMQ